VIARDVLALFYIVPLAPENDYSTIGDVPDYLSRAIPYFLGMVVLEVLYKVDLYNLKDTVMSISLGIVQQLVGLWMKESLLLPYLFVYGACAPLRNQVYSHLPQMSGYAYDMLFFLWGFLGNDIGYYCLHRSAHEWHLLWAAHGVHHSGERYNLASALRQGAFQSAYSWFFYLPMAAFGLPPVHYIRHARLNLVYQFWVHTEVVGRMHWLLELFFNTPSHHRMHHRPPGNCNYAGVLVIWDRLFCTFLSERHMYRSRSSNAPISAASRGVVYGLAMPLNDYDPVYANLAHISRMTVDKHRSTSDVGAGFSLWKRFVKLLEVATKKRVRQPLQIASSWEQFMPDILYDWQLARKCASELKDGECFNAPLYVQHLWAELWATPPSVEASDKASTPGMAQLSNRDLEFVKGRSMREGKSKGMSSLRAATVATHFLISLAVGYATIMQGSKVRESGATALYWALVCVGCTLSLQSIKLYY